MFCTQCGIQMPDGAKFCSACGAAQHGAAAAVEQPKSNVALKLAATGGLVAILAAAAYTFYSPGPGPAPAPVAAPAAAPVAAAPVAAAPPPPPTPAPEPKAAEPPAPVSEPAPGASAPDPAEIAAAHQALDQKISDEEAAAKTRATKK